MGDSTPIVEHSATPLLQACIRIDVKWKYKGGHDCSDPLNSLESWKKSCTNKQLCKRSGLGDNRPDLAVGAKLSYNFLA